MTHLQSLDDRFAVDGRIAFEASPLGGPIVRLLQGAQEVLVALHGGHVLNWTDGGEGLLWMSPVARITAGKGLRGGIPVCWPWFGDHATDATKPAHGFVRQRAWTVIGSAATSEASMVMLSTATSTADDQLWPHQAEVRLTVTLSKGLSLFLETRNRGAGPLLLTQALHTYFRVSDIGRVEVRGLEGCAYLDKREGFKRKVQTGVIQVAGEVDRIYVGETGRIELADAGAQRVMRVVSTGSGSAVVWNPWSGKTARLGDMGSPEAYRQMLCIETSNAGDDRITVAPGGRHVMGVAYEVVRG